MSHLFLSPEGQAKAHALALFAAQPANWYRVGESRWVPGDRPEYTCTIDSYRCVFTYTLHAGELHRHLSISVVRPQKPGALPAPIAAWTLASWFGFTGGKAGPGGTIVDRGADWMIGTGESPIAHAIIVQSIGPSGEGTS